MKHIYRTILIAIAVAFSIGLAAMVSEATITAKDDALKEYKQKLRNTKHICQQVADYPRQDSSLCQQLQQETQTEFLCNDQGHCWLEFKVEA